ncbi:hypothetical protein BCV72DRAFT_124113 [Rhizopus microsporus var. microsporus]|uniref:Uncharacterized protein n=1 Tax=Rhizopus microsporus var. microsporus TaxID=86635 RepID=A0A1X0R305_RHIZD|nr:hypothetical protein BCV72DRAFT_124113 [Rhizopus microsporus var. microsporus]
MTIVIFVNAIVDWFDHFYSFFYRIFCCNFFLCWPEAQAALLVRYSFEYYVWTTDFGQNTFHRIENSFSFFVIDTLVPIFVEKRVLYYIS